MMDLDEAVTGDKLMANSSFKEAFEISITAGWIKAGASIRREAVTVMGFSITQARRLSLAMSAAAPDGGNIYIRRLLARNVVSEYRIQIANFTMEDILESRIRNSSAMDDFAKEFGAILSTSTGLEVSAVAHAATIVRVSPDDENRSSELVTPEAEDEAGVDLRLFAGVILMMAALAGVTMLVKRHGCPHLSSFKQKETLIPDPEPEESGTLSDVDELDDESEVGVDVRMQRRPSGGTGPRPGLRTSLASLSPKRLSNPFSSMSPRRTSSFPSDEPPEPPSRASIVASGAVRRTSSFPEDAPPEPTSRASMLVGQEGRGRRTSSFPEEEEVSPEPVSRKSMLLGLEDSPVAALDNDFDDSANPALSSELPVRPGRDPTRRVSALALTDGSTSPRLSSELPYRDPTRRGSVLDDSASPRLSSELPVRPSQNQTERIAAGAGSEISPNTSPGTFENSSPSRLSSPSPRLSSEFPGRSSRSGRKSEFTPLSNSVSALQSTESPHTSLEHRYPRLSSELQPRSASRQTGRDMGTGVGSLEPLALTDAEATALDTHAEPSSGFTFEPTARHGSEQLMVVPQERSRIVPLELVEDAYDLDDLHDPSYVGPDDIESTDNFTLRELLDESGAHPNRERLPAQTVPPMEFVDL